MVVGTDKGGLGDGRVAPPSHISSKGVCTSLLLTASAKWKVAVSTATPNIEISSLNFDPDILSCQTRSKGTSTLKGTRNLNY